MALPCQVHAYGGALGTLAQAYADYDADAVTVSLHGPSYTPHASHTSNADLRGEASGYGYTRRPLQGREVGFDAATQRFQFRAARVVWPQVTLTARWAVVRFTDAGNQPNLLGWVDLGSTHRIAEGAFTLGFENDVLLEVEGVG